MVQNCRNLLAWNVSMHVFSYCYMDSWTKIISCRVHLLLRIFCGFLMWIFCGFLNQEILRAWYNSLCGCDKLCGCNRTEQTRYHAPWCSKAELFSEPNRRTLLQHPDSSKESADLIAGLNQPIRCQRATRDEVNVSNNLQVLPYAIPCRPVDHDGLLTKPGRKAANLIQSWNNVTR